MRSLSSLVFVIGRIFVNIACEIEISLCLIETSFGFWFQVTGRWYKQLYLQFSDRCQVPFVHTFSALWCYNRNCELLLAVPFSPKFKALASRKTFYRAGSLHQLERFLSHWQRAQRRWKECLAQHSVMFIFLHLIASENLSFVYIVFQELVWWLWNEYYERIWSCAARIGRHRLACVPACGSIVFTKHKCPQEENHPTLDTQHWTSNIGTKHSQSCPELRTSRKWALSWI